ncbi:MAG TPA: HEAT repeat domain-containing protein [Nitrososphaerales archaeon]|nr:HEAT repeat domain-containing protein [Nitrososphaerales archaeon]
MRRKQPGLLSSNKPLVVKALLDCARKDTSPTARHEAIETLGYLGDKSILKPLKALSMDTNPDISATAKIAIGLVNFRLTHPGPESDLGRRILDAQRSGPKAQSVI